MAPRSSALLAAALACACGSSRNRVAPPPPPEAPTQLGLEPEHVRRGQSPSAATADTERPEGRIRAAVLRERSGIQNCYERILPASPDAAGRIDFRFNVEVSGLITDATGETETPALRPTQECILALIRRTRVQGIEHVAQVTYPFQFDNPPLELRVPEEAITPRARFAPPESVAALVGAGSGNLTADEAHHVVEPHLPDIQTCYTTLLRTARRAEGTLRYELTIAPDGTLADLSSVDATEGLQPVRDCVTALLRGLHFRDTGRRTVITLPFAFRPREPAATPTPTLAPPARPAPPRRPAPTPRATPR